MSKNTNQDNVPKVAVRMLDKKKVEVPSVGIVEKPPTWVQALGGRLASRVLWFVCGLAVLFLIAWWLTRPSLEEVQRILDASAEPKTQAKEIVELLRDLRRDHFDHFRDLFQLVVLSGLVPLFTLLAGYAFGSSEREKREQEESE